MEPNYLLPKEIWQPILAYCNFLSKIRLIQVCKYFNGYLVIDDTDVVVGYISFAHRDHTEDWPFIRLEPQSVHLVPHNFFEWNSASTLKAQSLVSCDDLKPV